MSRAFGKYSSTKGSVGRDRPAALSTDWPNPVWITRSTIATIPAITILPLRGGATRSTAPKKEGLRGHVKS